MLKIAFCSCNHPLVHPQQPGWLALAENKPDVLLLLGDNVYVEQNELEIIGGLRPAVALSDLAYGQRLHAMYSAQWQVPQFRQALEASRLVLGTLDDHDFLGNDVYVSPSLQRKATFARLLHRQFIAACNTRPLPRSYPAFDDVFVLDDVGFERGIGLATAWQSEPERSGQDRSGQNLGEDHLVTKIILLDNRSYRERPPLLGFGRRVALGSAQISWLAQELVGSQRLTIVASGSTFSAGQKLPIRGSPLRDYIGDASTLRGFYSGLGSGNRVIHLGGDLHYNDFWPWSNEHPFTEIASSGMGTGLQPFSNDQYGNFGLLSVGESSVHLQTFGAEEKRNLNIVLPIGTQS
jgi:hypothetical protein